MNQSAAEPQSDDLLFRFLDARGEAESEALLEQLVVKFARPLVKEIVGFKLRTSSGGGGDRQEVEDVSGEVITRLIRTLRDHKSSPRIKPLASLRGYVAAMAYNAADEYLRQKYPHRHRLKNKVRYVLTHRPELALWESEGRQVLCGLARWGRSHRKAGPRVREARDDLDVFLRGRFHGAAFARVPPADLIAAVLEFAGAPLEIDELVNVTAELLGVRDARPSVEPEYAPVGDLPRLSSDPRGAIDETLDRRTRLRRVWEEILQLPPRQRVALLLNLREEGGGAAIALLPVLRVATLRQIAAALEMTAEELATIWNQLPLEDAAIGGKLGASQQQVANLRKCARERLARRLAGA